MSTAEPPTQHDSSPVDTDPATTTRSHAAQDHASHQEHARHGASDGREPLFAAPQADAYTARWEKVKGAFVYEPRQAVEQADQLVSEVLDELQALFGKQRQSLGQSLQAEDSSTEDLRIALGRYRGFFDRLLSL
jgi:hypothetical protein